VDDSRRCTARSKRSGQRCQRAAIVGGYVCSLHGGKAPAVASKALQRIAAAEAQAYVEAQVTTRGPMSLSEVYRELLRTAALAVEWRNLLEGKVGELEQWRYRASGQGTEQLRAEVALFERAMDRTAKVLELVARLDIEARADALDARQGQLVASAVQRIIEGLDLTPAQLARVPHVVPAELRRIAAEQVD